MCTEEQIQERLLRDLALFTASEKILAENIDIPYSNLSGAQTKLLLELEQQKVEARIIAWCWVLELDYRIVRTVAERHDWTKGSPPDFKGWEIELVKLTASQPKK